VRLVWLDDPAATFSSSHRRIAHGRARSGAAHHFLANAVLDSRRPHRGHAAHRCTVKNPNEKKTFTSRSACEAKPFRIVVAPRRRHATAVRRTAYNETPDANVIAPVSRRYCTRRAQPLSNTVPNAARAARPPNSQRSDLLNATNRSKLAPSVAFCGFSVCGLMFAALAFAIDR